jgi:predicted GNAT family N-acyltransferase
MITVKRIQSIAELNEMVVVRDQVYRASGKTSPDPRAEMEGLLQTSIHILCFYRDGKVIGSVTINACRDKLNWTPEAYHHQLPPAGETLEIGRLFLVNSARTLPILLKVFHAIHKVTRLHQRKYLVISSDKRLESLYKRMNFKPTGLVFTKNQQGKIAPLQIMLANHQQLGVYGLFAGPIKWCTYMKPVIDDLVKNDEYRLPWKEKLIYRLYSPFSPLTQKILKVKL